MKRVQALSTTLILSIACSMPATLSAGTLQRWATAWLDLQAYSPACKAKAVNDPNFVLAIQNENLPDFPVPPTGSIACGMGAIRASEPVNASQSVNASQGVNIKFSYELNVAPPFGPPERICKGKGKTGGDGLADFTCDVDPEVLAMVLDAPSDFSFLDGTINVRGRRKVNCLGVACVNFICNSTQAECSAAASIALTLLAGAEGERITTCGFE